MNAVVTTAQSPSVINDMATRYGMDRRAFEATLKATIMPAGVSDEQVAAFLLVAKKYDLNPFTKEIFAFPSRGGIQPIVSIDGWLKIINSHPQFDGMEFDDKLDDKGNLVAITCRIYRKDHSRSVEVTEYMTECKGTTDVWKRWPARMLRHKAAIQAGRYAFGFSGIVDPDEAERIESVGVPATARTIDMPQSKSKTKDEPDRSDKAMHEVFDDLKESVKKHEYVVLQDAEESTSSEPHVTDQTPGIFGLSDSLVRVLIETARVAGVTREQLLARYPHIDAGNYKAIRTELQDMAVAE